MVYSNKFVICVLVNGKPQKELANGTVNLPFGCEYAIRLRNKHKQRRACADIYIDGEKVSGNGYIVPANDHVDIKRHHDKDRAFKVVSLDSPEAVDAGKNGPNDDKTKGVIEVRWKKEKKREKVVEQFEPPYYPIRPIRPEPWIEPRPISPRSWQPWYKNYDESLDQLSPKDMSFGALRSDSSVSQTSETSMRGSSSVESPSVGSYSESKTQAASNMMPPPNVPLQDICTVEGNKTGQKFTSVWFEAEGTETVLKIFLQGFEDQELVEKIQPKKKKSKKDKEIERLRKELEDLKSKVS